MDALSCAVCISASVTYMTAVDILHLAIVEELDFIKVLSLYNN